MDSPQHCHVGWNWLWVLWRVGLPRKVCAVFRLCPLADFFLPCLKDERATSSRLPKTAELVFLFYFFFAAPRTSRLDQTRRCDGGRRKATDDRRIVYVSFWISFRDLQSVHPAKVISHHEWTPAAAAANKCRLDGIDASRKRMPFQLSRQEMHRKFFDQILR